MTLATRVLYEFGKFRLNPSEHILLGDGKPVEVTPKAFQILCVLAQNSEGRKYFGDFLRESLPELAALSRS